MEMCTLPCPYCGEHIALGAWVAESASSSLSCGRCGEGGEFLARLRHRRKALSQALSVSCSIFEMTDALWDTYRDALEQADAYSALSKG